MRKEPPTRDKNVKKPENGKIQVLKENKRGAQFQVYKELIIYSTSAPLLCSVSFPLENYSDAAPRRRSTGGVVLRRFWAIPTIQITNYGAKNWGSTSTSEIVVSSKAVYHMLTVICTFWGHPSWKKLEGRLENWVVL